MDPHAGKLLRAQASIHLPVKEVGDRLVIEFDRHLRALLFDKLHVVDAQQVIAATDSEPTHFRVTQIPQVQQLRPRIRTETQRR